MTSEGMDLHRLPEGCVADIFSLTSPRDACRISLVSTVFRAAADSDSVWERFLPSDYESIIARSADGSSSVFAKKKHVYLRLCDTPLLIDEGMKSFSLDKSSGKKCYMIAARDLAITWGDTPHYWTWISHPDSRFAEVAELLDVCWLEIRGKINTLMLSTGTKYAAYIVFKLTPDARGLGYHTSEVSVQIVGEEDLQKRNVYLYPIRGERVQTHPYYSYLPEPPQSWIHPYHTYEPAEQRIERENRYPKERGDGWLEIELGEYFNHEGGHDQELEMSLVETKGLNWKSGLIVQGIEIRPAKIGK